MRRTVQQTFAAPLLLLVLTLAGLAVGLALDDRWDWLAIVLLATPLVVMAHALRRRSGGAVDQVRR